jgi:4-alpha-glucanotransferase
MAVWYDGLPQAEREQLRRLPALSGLDASRPFDDRARDLLLAALYSAPSTLALIPFQDALGTRERINVPGTVNDANWRFRAARSVDDLLADAADIERLRQLATDAGRLERR